MSKAPARDKAEAALRAVQKANRGEDRSKAAAEYQTEAEERAVLTAKLKSLRLARDAEQAKAPPAKRASRSKKVVAHTASKSSSDAVDTSPRETAKRDWVKSWRD